MRSHYALLALVAVWLGSSTAWAQFGQADVTQLRQQIDALQRQLAKIEAGPDANAHVTQLGSKRASTREPELAVRIYDLSDLFAMAPAYPAKYFGGLGGGEQLVFPMPATEYAAGRSRGMMGGMGGMGGGGGFFSIGGQPASAQGPKPEHLSQVSQSQAASGADARTSMDSLIDAITSTIAPTTWDEVGGPGSIAQVGNSLLISTDRPTHEQIDELLTLFRKKWGTLRTISVRATWLWLGDEQLARLLPGDGLQKFDDHEAYGIVDEAAWKKLQSEPAPAGADARAGYKAIVTCYNGQTVSTVSGGQTQLVTHFEPLVIKGDGKETKDRSIFRPVPVRVNDGAALQVTPMANTSGKFVVIDVHSRINRLRDRSAGARPADKKPVPIDDSSPEKLLLAIDRSILMTSELDTTLRVPVDRTVLVGGMTFESEPRPGEPNLYLFVKLSVQELRDDLPKAKKEAGEAEPAREKAAPAGKDADKAEQAKAVANP